MANVETLGQVFTPEDIVKRMLEFRQNQGRALEPSCGHGAFSTRLEDCVAIELDDEICSANTINMDFFDYPLNNKFSTIVGNPPYVRFQDVMSSTKIKLNMCLFDNRTNLYMFFIHKCIQHLEKNGELIFIVPRDFLKATSCIRLNQWLYEQGTITDLIDMGDKIIFPGFSPNCVIFRFEKDNFTRKTNKDLNFVCVKGQLFFTKNEYSARLDRVFSVKVGAVSGADEVFQHPEGNTSFVYSRTRETGETRKMIYQVKADQLLEYKERLLQRGIREFDENNWWQWGRDQYHSEDPRIYINCKTRQEDPFFTHPCNNYDGAVLALFPHKKDVNLDELVDMLNRRVDWENLGFVCDGRFLFSQKALENTVLPSCFEIYEVNSAQNELEF